MKTTNLFKSKEQKNLPVYNGNRVIDSAVLIGTGAAKLVYKIGSDPTQAYYVPRSSSRGTELKKEVETAQKIRTAVEKLQLASTHLAVDLTPASNKVNYKYTIKTLLANGGDLEEWIKKTDLLFTDRLELALQCLKGFSTLHAAGFIHGDIKPDNILILRNKNETTIKISDWGKTEELSSSEASIYRGNHRFSSPEHINSHQAEVYSLGLLLTRIFEEGVLSPKEEMLVTPKTKRRHLVPKCARGFVKYFFSHPKCRSPRVFVLRKWIAWRKRNQLYKNTKSQQTNHAIIHDYINVLSNKIAEKEGNQPGSIQVATQIGNLIKEMTHSDPKQRPTSLQALETLQKIAHLNDLVRNPLPVKLEDPYASLFGRISYLTGFLSSFSLRPKLPYLW